MAVSDGPKYKQGAVGSLSVTGASVVVTHVTTGPALCKTSAPLLVMESIRKAELINVAVHAAKGHVFHSSSHYGFQ